MSARVASPAVEGRSPSDPVRALQHALYRAAKAGLNFESMELPSEPSLMLNVYTVPVGSSTEDGLKLLASWAATQESAQPSEQPAATVEEYHD